MSTDQFTPGIHYNKNKCFNKWAKFVLNPLKQLVKAGKTKASSLAAWPNLEDTPPTLIPPAPLPPFRSSLLGAVEVIYLSMKRLVIIPQQDEA